MSGDKDDEQMECPNCDGNGFTEEYCDGCNGSGEGSYDGSSCSYCHGSSISHVECNTCNGDTYE